MSNSLSSYQLDDCVFCPNSSDYFEFDVEINGFKISCKQYQGKYHLYIDEEYIQIWNNRVNDISCGFPFDKLDIFSLLEDKESYFYELIERGFEIYTNAYGGMQPNIMHHIFNIPMDDIQFLIRQFNFFEQEIDHARLADNHRVCILGDAKGEAAYSKAANTGCCGFFDDIIEHPKTKVKYRIGFNYGH